MSRLDVRESRCMCERPNGDAFVCVDRTSSHKHARSRLTGRCDLASVFHDVVLRVIRHDQDRQIRPWHSCGDPGDLSTRRSTTGYGTAERVRGAIVFIVNKGAV